MDTTDHPIDNHLDYIIDGKPWAPLDNVEYRTKVIAKLNDLFKTNPKAMAKLTRIRVETEGESELPFATTLGLINHLFGSPPTDPQRRIVAVEQTEDPDSQKLLGFSHWVESKTEGDGTCK